jgi:hypothetical protein
MCGFCDDLKRRHHNVSAGNVLCRFGVAFEIFPLLKDFDGLIIGGRREMIVVRLVPHFHATIRDFSL